MQVSLESDIMQLLTRPEMDKNLLSTANVMSVSYHHCYVALTHQKCYKNSYNAVITA